ncbi:ArnT family glycosyltransferase [Spirillospora sp. NPDC048911]|uniref:ArnT family glycosyltransferase n=1 Tax=Spirillospora sp. NPDC048911 TaxID=3364527 RepID=UPI0037135E2E
MTQTTLRSPDAGRNPATAAPEAPRRPAPPRRPLPLRLLRRGVVWKSLLVAAAGLLVQWMIMPPPLYADPFYVFTAGKLWPDIPIGEEPFLDVPHQITRMGLVLPTMVAERLLGDGQAAYFAVAALGGCLFFVGAFLAVRSLFGETAGLVTALVLLVHPFFILVNPYGSEVTWATGAILPDMPGAGLFALGVAALVTASRRAGRRQTQFLLMAGLFFGCAFLAREFLAFMYLAIPAFVALLRVPLRRLTVIAAPMLGVLAVNLVHNAVVFGDPLTELRSAAGHGGMPAEPVTRMDALTSFPRAMYEWDALGTIFIVALALNVVGFLATRDRRLAFTLVWFATLWAPLTLMSGTLDPTDISLRGWLVRYWFAVLPALAAGGLGSLILLTRRFGPPLARSLVPPAIRFGAPLADRLGVPRGKRRAVARRAGTVTAGALAIAVAAAYLVPAGVQIAEQPRDTAWAELRGWLSAEEDPPVETIWADERLGQTLSFYTQDVWGEQVWDGEIRTFRQIDGELPVAAVNGPLLYTEWRGQEPPSSNGVRPSTESGWELEWRSSDDVLELWDRR